MAAKIRLKRVGKKNRPYFRVVVIDESKARDGTEIEIVGQYAPVETKDRYKFDGEKILSWIKKGAVPSERVRILLGEAGILPKVSFEGRTKRKPRAEEKAEAEAKPEEKKAEAKAGVKEGEKKEEAKAEAKEAKPEEKPKKEEKAEAKPDEKKTEVKAEAKKEEKKEEKAEAKAEAKEKPSENKEEAPKA